MRLECRGKGGGSCKNGPTQANTGGNVPGLWRNPSAQRTPEPPPADAVLHTRRATARDALPAHGRSPSSRRESGHTVTNSTSKTTERINEVKAGSLKISIAPISLWAG